MKGQDIIFFVIFGFLLIKQNPKWSAISGILALFLSIPLFSFWIFFTAQRLTFYASGFFFLAVILSIIKLRKNK